MGGSAWGSGLTSKWGLNVYQYLKKEKNLINNINDSVVYVA